MKTPLKVECFTDLRTFLMAHTQFKKDTNPQWTYGLWAKQLNLKSTSSITKVVRGQREAGDELTQKLVQYFKFNSHETEYFRDLVSINKIKKNPQLYVLLLEKMAKNKPGAMSHVLNEKTFSIISNWYCLALREMVRLDQFKEDPRWISKQMAFKVKPSDLKIALDNLIEAKLIVRNKKGRLELTQERVKTDDDVAIEGIKRYHEQMSLNAAKAVRLFEVDVREFNSSTFLFSQKNIEAAKRAIREFKTQFVRLFEEPSGEQVYQMQIQFFPVTKKIGSSKHENQ
jgi:uncharacterized protein (TIGR02147 family)